MAAIPPSPPRPVALDVLANLPRLDRHKPKCGPVRPSKSSRKRAYVLIGVHVLIGLHFLHWGITGSSVTPVEPSESMQTVELGKINAGFLLFVSLIATTLIFGRWFCGWACHVVALQDLSAWLLARVGLKPRPVRSRLLVLAPWVVAGHMFAWPVIESWLGERKLPLPPVSSWELHLTTDDLWKTFPGPVMAIGTFVVVGFLIVWWLGAKGFCTYGCPYGAFFAVADRFAPVRIKVTDACDGCGHCTSVCTSNVRVHEEVAKHKQIVDPGCMKCMDCVSVCPKDALYIGIAAPKPFATSQQRIRMRADFTWPEEILLAVTALVATQWVFRGAWFFEGVPLLMAVGLGVITAVFALLALRLLRRPEMTFQHTPLKIAGRLTRAGRWAGLLLAAWLGFCVHTWSCHYRRDTLFAAMKAVPASASPAQLDELVARADAALAWDFVDDPFVEEMRGLLLWRLGREAEGGAALLASYHARGRLDIEAAKLNLAMFCLPPRGQRLDIAEKLVRHVLVLRPQHPLAVSMLREIERLRK
ncbi:MAG: 4Fe-4S binding protein [Planctomycetota bacterium]